MKGIRIQLAIISILLIVVGIILLTLFSPDQETSISKNMPTPTPPLNRLAEREITYPTAKPQPTEFYKNSPTGTLVVTSNVENTLAFVVNVTEKDSHGAHDEEYSRPIPMNMTPFSHENFPAGEYFLRGLKDGYIADEKNITIKKGEVTRIHLILKPR